MQVQNNALTFLKNLAIKGGHKALIIKYLS